MSRQKTITSIVISHLLFFLLLILHVSHAHAQVPENLAPTPTPTPLPDTGLSLLVSPPLLDLRTEPNSTVSAKIKIKNNNEAAETLRIDLKKFVPDPSGGRPILTELNAGDLFPQWLHFSDPVFTIDSKASKTIDLTFAPPANAAPAYYFAIVFSRDQKIKPAENDKAALQGAAAVLCLVQVSSSRVYHQVDLQQLTSTGFDFKTKFIYEFLPVNFTVTLANSGNVHEKAYGNIFIDWVSGNKREVGMLNVNGDGSFILPQTTRSFESSWTNGFPVWEEQRDEDGTVITDKQGKPKRKLKWDFSQLSWFRIGKYRAQLLMIYNDGVHDIPLEAETSFWVIPWRILLAVLVILILLIIGFKGMIQGAVDKLKSARDRLNGRIPPPSVNR